MTEQYSYGNATPQVRCNHCGWQGADADLVRDVAADEPDDGAADVCPTCRRIGDLMDLAPTEAEEEARQRMEKANE